MHWKDPLKNVQYYKAEEPKQLLKRPKFVLNILYNNQGIYLSKRINKNKIMYNLCNDWTRLKKPDPDHSQINLINQPG